MTICVVTGTRAEYGILSELMKRLKDTDGVCLQIIATNMHLSPRYGMTVEEIEKDGFDVDVRIPLPLDDDSSRGTVKAMSVAMDGFADAFASLNPDMILILGDRYEMLAAASAAAIFGIPVAHLHGGEITEGAYDDFIRHAITKLSTYHFTATEEYRQRVIQMGEEPERVFNVGSAAVDAISRFKPMSKEALAQSLGVKLADGFIVVTFHPVTMQPGEVVGQTDALLEALDETVIAGKKENEVCVIFTMPNSDAEGRAVAEMTEKWCAVSHGRALAVKSLGRVRYYSALAHAAAVVGNSSSGLIEAPSVGIPTLNIGDRQKGRSRGNTVFECTPQKEDICAALRHILSPEVREYCQTSGINPYHKEGSVDSIYRILLSLSPKRFKPKHFFDIDF